MKIVVCFQVSTQFRASPFKRALFSTLNRVLLINCFLNLTLAGSQSDFTRNHVNIIPTPVKDVFEKSSDEVPDRTQNDWRDSP